MGIEPTNMGDPTGAAMAEGQAAPGICVNCGQPLPEPDLEGVAADVDHRLSLEFGQLVPRSAWAGRAPDGMLDGLLSFMPGVRAKRAMWQRGQSLWTELMTGALTGPCERCRGAGAPAGPPAPTMMQAAMPEPGGTLMLGPDAAIPGRAPRDDRARPTQPAQDTPAGFDLPTRAAPIGVPIGRDDPRHDARPLPETDRAPALPQESPTMALFDAPPIGHPPPAPQPANDTADIAAEYEAHTVMVPSLPHTDTGPVLVVLEGPVRGHQFSVDRTTTTIGRSIGCHITIDDRKVGYEHARLIRNDAGWRLEVTPGTEDTYVNDERVSRPRLLKSGDIVRIGPARLRFEAAG
jgi:hypothetical protein